MLGQRYGFNCPHCGKKMLTTMSRYVDPKMQERYLQCRNEQCFLSRLCGGELKQFSANLLYFQSVKER